VFLDEATSAIDDSAEAHLYSRLRLARSRPTVISVGHRSELKNFHDHILDLRDFAPNGLRAPAKGPLARHGA
jgi:putative ATP-binding cassette transporter